MQHQEMINPTHAGIITRTALIGFVFMLFGMIFM